VQGLGDLCFDRVLLSETRAPRQVSLKFVVRDGGPVTVSWVSPQGDLLHNYPLLTGATHSESSFLGHAFVVFRGDSRPRRARDISVSDLVCCYRPTRPAECHVVTLWSGYRVTVSEEDNEYRVVVHPSPGFKPVLPCASEDWEVQYTFLCSPLPCAAFDPGMETLYVWGDLSFDKYGASSECPLTRYVHNQIVPQVMLGRCLSSSEAFLPSWSQFDTWVMQAQYFWGTARDHFAQCGDVCHVHGGDEITSTIAYSAGTGSIRVTISTTGSERQCSSIDIKRPFPNDPQLFRSWRDFFEQAQAASRTEGPVGRPNLNIEYKGNVEVTTLASLCPFEVRAVSYPSLGMSGWRTSLFCPRVGYCQELADPVMSCGQEAMPRALHASSSALVGTSAKAA